MHNLMRDLPPWKVRSLTDYRVFLLEAPNLTAVLGTPEGLVAGQPNLYSMPLVIKGAAFVTHDSIQVPYYLGQTSTDWWPDSRITLSNDGKYVCIFPLYDKEHNLVPVILNADDSITVTNTTIISLEGSLLVNGYTYNGIHQINVSEPTEIKALNKAVLVQKVI